MGRLCWALALPLLVCVQTCRELFIGMGTRLNPSCGVQALMAAVAESAVPHSSSVRAGVAPGPGWTEPSAHLSLGR